MKPFLFLSTIVLTLGNNLDGSGHIIHANDPSSQGEIGDPVNELGDNLMLVFQDRGGSFWFGTGGDGLYRYDGKTAVHFTTKHGLPHDRVEEILEGKDGYLYFNTSTGVSRFDGREFSTLPVANGSEWKLNETDLWFKYPMYTSSKVYRYDGKMLHALTIPKIELGERYQAKYPRSPTPYAVYTVYRDGQKNVWFGTSALGVCRYDGKSFDWISSDDVTELHDGPSNGVRSMVEDDEGLFWFNTRFRYCVNEKAQAVKAKPGEFELFTRLEGIGSLDGNANSDSYEYMSSVKDDHGNLWFATYADGVYCYDGVKINHFEVLKENKPVTIFSIYRDNRGEIWLGTHENGAYRFDGKAFVRFRASKR